MKTTQHEFSLELYNKAIANPDKYEFVYRDGTKPLGVHYMKGFCNDYPVRSWIDLESKTHTIEGFYLKSRITDERDLFILEKHSITYREALESLPDGYRELALENAEKQGWYRVNPIDECAEISRALSGSIFWRKTLQGHDFWEAVKNHYENNSPLPPLPVKEEKGGVQETVIVDGGKIGVPKVDQERLDKFVCAFIRSGSSPEDAVSRAKETLKQLEGGEG